LAKEPLSNDFDTRRVEIIMLKFKEAPEIIDEAVTRIIHNTNWPFKLTIFDNRLNNANTSRIWNKLIKESTCDYVLIIDSDAYVPKLEPCWLTRMMESIDETGIVIPVSDAAGGAHQHVSNVEKYGSVVRNQDAWSGYCFLVHKSVFEKFGFFDERFYRYGQDSEWAIRTRKPGAMMRRDVLVRHIGGASFNNDPGKEADKIYARALFQKLTQ
jgi:GT2 family glycosyltransferase